MKREKEEKCMRTRVSIIKTKEYPIRYVAFDHFGALVENSHPRHDGGNEWAVFSELVQNKAYPHLTDGIYFEIVSYQGKALLLDATATRPDENRKQLRHTELFQTYEQAKRSALTWLEEARQFVAQQN
jgi:hypothetical protein